MAGQQTGGKVVQPNPTNQGKYLGNPNHINGGTMKSGGGLPQQSTPEYLKGFTPPQMNTMDSQSYTLDGKQLTGSSSYIGALTKHLNDTGQGHLLTGGTYTPQATIPNQNPTVPSIGIQPPPTVAQPNINTLAAEGIKAAGTTTGQGLSFTPQQVSVAGNSATVTPTNVTNANVVGSNMMAQQVGQQNASPQVMAERLANTNMTQYMNPYTDEVIKANEADIMRSTNMGLNALGAQAQAAGGFGGSRHGIAMGEMGRGMTDALARTSAGLRQAGFQNAQEAARQDIANNFQSQMANQQGGQFDISRNIDVQRMNQAANLQAAQQNQANALQAALANQSTGLQSGLANQSYNFQGQRANQQAGQQDISNRLQAALANQSAGLSGNSQRMGAAQQLGSLSNLGFNMGQTVNNNMAQQGAMQQALQQVILDNAKAKFAGYTGQPAAGIGYLSGAIGATPTTNTETLSKQNGLFDYLTLGASILGK